MNEKHLKQGQPRRLPKIPTKQNGNTFCMSYQESQMWLQRHSEILNKTVSLLEDHPRLIQLRCCDRLLDFITKVSVCNYGETTVRFNGMSKKSIEQKSCAAAMKLPNIFISDSDVHQNKDKSLIKKVYIFGKKDDSKWSRMIVGLCEQFLVKFCRDETPDKDNTLNQQLNGIDALLLITDESPVNDKEQLNMWKAAKDCGLPVLRVRNENCNKSVIEAQFALCVTEQTHTYINNNSDCTQDRSISDLSLTDPDIFRPDSGISSLLGRSSNCSTEFKLTSNTKDKDVYNNDHTDNDHLFTYVHMKAELNNTVGEMTNTMSHEYENAITYNESFHEECMKTISCRIEQMTGNTESNILQDHQGLPVVHNQPEDTDTKTKSVEAVEIPETDCDNIHTRRSRRKSSGTVFMVFPLKITGDREPTFVHYHEEDATASMSPSQSMDSLGFQDIDLSQIINGSEFSSQDDGDELIK